MLTVNWTSEAVPNSLTSSKKVLLEVVAVEPANAVLGTLYATLKYSDAVAAVVAAPQAYELVLLSSVKSTESPNTSTVESASATTAVK